MLNDDHPLKRVPAGAVQHVTAGPYSPVLEVKAERLVVLSGQVAVDLDGNVVGDDHRGAGRGDAGELPAAARERRLRFPRRLQGQRLSRRPLPNGRASTPSTRRRMPAPLPVRTAVQAVLLDGFRVEIEMWAVKPTS